MDLNFLTVMAGAVTSVVGVYEACIFGLDRWCQQLEEVEASKWLEMVSSFERTSESEIWQKEAKRFWKMDTTAGFQWSYYRGVPVPILTNLIEHDEKSQSTEISPRFVKMADAAFEQAKAVASNVTGDPDNEKVHRLYAFPALPTIQAIPIAGAQTQRLLCGKIENLLVDVRHLKTPYTPSACNQIAQIVPQILTDQLLAGRHAWQRLIITNGLLKALKGLGPDKTGETEFEAGLSLSLQFLTYYKQSLKNPVKRKLLGADASKQVEDISKYFDGLRESRNPKVSNLRFWLDALEKHVKTPAHGREPYDALMRQSTMAIIANANGTQRIPPDLLALCLLNNLRAAHQSLGAPDYEARHKLVKEFLANHCITRQMAWRAVDQFVSKEEKVFRKEMKNFVTELPENPSLKPDPQETMATSRRLTIGHVFSQLTDLTNTTEVRGILRNLKKVKLWKVVWWNIVPAARSLWRLRRESKQAKALRFERLNEIVSEVIRATGEPVA